MLRNYLLIFAIVVAGGSASAQQTPDITTLLRQVQEHQQRLEQVRDTYTYRERQLVEELDKNGGIKKRETRELEVFFVNNHQVERLVGHDGKPLNAGEDAKETERVRKEVEKAEKTPPGQPTDPRTQISVGRLLSIVKFSNPRRMPLDNRSMLVFDFVGDPHAKTHGVAEDASKKLAGTIWIDEQDRQVRRLDARLDDTFHLGFGLFSLAKGSRFVFDQKLINNELWLPTTTFVHIEARAALLLNYRADVHVADDDYRRFRTDAQQKDAAPVTK